MGVLLEGESQMDRETCECALFVLKRSLIACGQICIYSSNQD